MRSGWEVHALRALRFSLPLQQGLTTHCRFSDLSQLLTICLGGLLRPAERCWYGSVHRQVGGLFEGLTVEVAPVGGKAQLTVAPAPE